MSEPDQAVRADPKARLSAITLDAQSIGHGGNHHIEHEREVAIFDILDGNVFSVVGRDDGPFKLTLSLEDDKLLFTLDTETEQKAAVHAIALAPFRRIIRDYFMLCDSYYEAIRTAPPARIQAIDANRRSLHDEGSRLLQDKLAGRIDVDSDTARRLFTLLAALHWRG